MLELLAAAIVASASCAIPPNLTPAPARPQEEQRQLPVTRLVLAYYWWPEQCRNDNTDPVGCKSGFGFKVHGLWPDSVGQTWPQFCRAPTPIDLPTVRANYCMTPSPGLMQHEWAKHGTCGWPTPAAYFAAARKVADTIALPDVDQLPKDGLTAGAIRDAIVAVNPKLTRAMLFVGTDKNQWLTEMRVCLTTDYAPMPCIEGDYGAADRATVRVWPR